MNKLVVYFRPPDEFVDHLSGLSNKFKLILCKKRDELESHLAEIEILITLFAWPDAEMIRQASQLRWIQALTAGVDFLPLKTIEEQGIILTSGRGIHKIYIAEYAIAAMINLARNFNLMFRNQLNSKWDRSIAQDEINGSTAGILGLGSIGQEIARKASMLGMRVIGVKNSPIALEGVDHVYSPTEMEEVFKQSDYVINLLPDTPQTIGLIDKSFFSSMKKSACFINLGRGSTVNQTDLIDALQNNTIRALVSILTPHIAGASPKYLQRAMDIIEHNLHVYVGGTGEMVSQVDFAKGY
jgi:phosphoglycerate dehydrogenase-like enzyme